MLGKLAPSAGGDQGPGHSYQNVHRLVLLARLQGRLHDDRRVAFEIDRLHFPGPHLVSFQLESSSWLGADLVEGSCAQACRCHMQFPTSGHARSSALACAKFTLARHGRHASRSESVADTVASAEQLRLCTSRRPDSVPKAATFRVAQCRCCCHPVCLDKSSAAAGQLCHVSRPSVDVCREVRGCAETLATSLISAVHCRPSGDKYRCFFLSCFSPLHVPSALGVLNLIPCALLLSYCALLDQVSCLCPILDVR